MKKTVIFLLTLALLLLSPLSSFAAIADGNEPVEPMYDIAQDFRMNVIITGESAEIYVAYSIWNEPVSNVKITVSMIRKVSLFVYIVGLDNGGISYEYTSSQLSGTATVGADASASGTYIATAKIEVTNANGSVTTDTLSATQTKS